MSQKREYRRYDKDFKETAIKLVTVGGRKARDVEKELGLYCGAINLWQKAQIKGDSTPSSDPSIEDKALRKELAQLKMENEILKKAMGYLAKSQH